MRRIVALQWDSQQVGVVVGSGRGSRLHVEQAFRVDLPEDRSIGATLTAALAAHRVGRAEVVVAIRRSEVELRQLAMPAAPDAELPELVRFQALREFNRLDEDWPLDFVTLDQQPDQPRHVLAAAVRPSLVQEISEACEAAGLRPLRLVLRCCAAASLLKEPPSSAAQVLVDLSGEEVDLTVYDQRRVVFLRQTRLAGSPLADPAAASLLVAELRRTVAAARNRPCDVPVASVVLWNVGTGTAALAESLAQSLGMPVRILDPLEGITGGAEQRTFSDEPGYLAPLVGLLRDELTAEPAAFDFLHPRRRAEPPSRRRTYLLAGVAVGVLFLGFLMNNWLEKSDLAERIAQLQKESNRLGPQVEQAQQRVKAAKAIGQWTSSERNWLEELQWLSAHLPPAENAVLTHLSLNSRQEGGELVLEGMARDVEAVTHLESGLSDGAAHRLSPKSSSQKGAKPPYAIHFTSSLSLGTKEP